MSKYKCEKCYDTGWCGLDQCDCQTPYTNEFLKGRKYQFKYCSACTDPTKCYTCKRFPWKSQQDKIEFENEQFLKGSKRGREDMKRDCLKKLKEEFYFRRGPNSEEPILYANEIIAAIEAVPA